MSRNGGMTKQQIAEAKKQIIDVPSSDVPRWEDFDEFRDPVMKVIQSPLALIPYLESEVIEPFLDPKVSEICNTLTNDVIALVDESEQLYSQHRDRRGFVESEDAPLVLTLTAGYQDLTAKVNALILPSFMHASQLIQDAELAAKNHALKQTQEQEA